MQQPLTIYWSQRQQLIGTIHITMPFTIGDSKRTGGFIPCYIGECVSNLRSANSEAISRLMRLGDNRCHARVISSCRFYPYDSHISHSNWSYNSYRIWTAIYNRWQCVLISNCVWMESVVSGVEVLCSHVDRRPIYPHTTYTVLSLFGLASMQGCHIQVSYE